MSALLLTPTLAVTPLSSTEAAKTERDNLLKEASAVTTVTDRLDADSALPVLRALNSFLSEVESQRETAKAPVLDLGRKIDALAKELTTALKLEEDRISKLCGSFEAEERRKAEDARRKADADAARIAYEAAENEKAARRAAPTELAAARASDAIAGKAQEEIAAVRQVAFAAIAPKAEGTRMSSSVCFEVTDLKVLYAAYPELVTLEPNGTAIRAICRANPELKIPGLKHWSEQKLNVR